MGHSQSAHHVVKRLAGRREKPGGLSVRARVHGVAALEGRVVEDIRQDGGKQIQDGAARTRTADLLSQHLWALGRGVLGDRWRLSVLPIHSNRPLPPRLGAAAAQ